MPEIETLAPEYRYYTVDLLSNEILSEIPFRGVSWERALKAAGQFSGKIPVNAQTKSMNLYESTSPGNTALFVVRNNVCVWGGIIWSREYDVINRDLSVSASEFTSYLYHRKIWKTWNHEYGATVLIAGGTGKIVFDYGSNASVYPGSSVHIEFYEPEQFKYNGYYRVSSNPAPTTTSFEVVGGYSLADIATVEVAANVAYITTSSKHGFNTGDLITVTSDYGSPFNGTFQITAPAGSETNLFTFPVVHADIAREASVGTAVRPVPDGVYLDATVSVRTDTYDYVRNLIDSMATDFVGTDFPNVYIEPGISYALGVTQKELAGGFATITTSGDHNLAIGQAVQVQDLGSPFDGEFEVIYTPTSNSFMYYCGGTLAPTAVTPTTAIITGVQLTDGVVTITTSSAHNFLVGQNVDIFVGYDFPDLNGDQKIASVPSSTTFTYEIISTLTIPSKTFVNATATVGASVRNISTVSLTSNAVTVTTVETHGFAVSDSVTIANVKRTVPIVQKALDAANSLATITTDGLHHFTTGQSVVIDGVQDSSHVTRLATTTGAATMTTEQGHNFKVGDSVTISGSDAHTITNKALTSNVATLTTALAHNVPVAAEITVSGLVDKYTVSNKMLSLNVATLTTSAAHNFNVNDKITVSGIADTARVISKTAENGVAILTLSAAHNFQESQTITVANVGAPFDGTYTVLAVTDTRVMYEIVSKSLILPAKVTASNATVTAADGYFNGEWVVSAKTSTTVSYARTGNDIASVAASGTLAGPSVMNGVKTVTGRTATTLSFAQTANDVVSAAVPAPETENDIPSLITLPTVYAGAKTLTAVTRNTFTFAQVLPSAVAVHDVNLTANTVSIFNGTKTITAVTNDTFQYTLAGTSNVLEVGTTNLSTATVASIFDGTYTITGVNAAARTFTYAQVYQDIPIMTVQSRGTGTVTPMAVISTFGPFPGNADIGFQFSTRGYSGVNVEPVAYRGFQLKTVGEALDAYSDNIEGFEYRVDCAYDEDLGQFTKTLVLIPINFPDAPEEGEVSPIERFGAEKLVFEYPGGSITDLRLEESAENSATRFFAQGETELGPDVGPNISIASSEDLLSGSNGGRRWPLMDETEKVSDVDDETVLYAYAKRYLSESRPPDAKLTISVNGSIAPYVSDYAPGDWCSLIVDDDFVLQRLASDMEPRNTVIVRKIDAYKVSVPDGVTFPEKVSLTLVPEWEVDKRG